MAVIWHISSNRWNSAITEYALSSARSLDLMGHMNYFSPLEGSPAERRSLLYDMQTKSLEKFGLGGIRNFLALYKKIQPQYVFVYGGPEATLCKFLPSDVKVMRFRGQDVSVKDWGLKATITQKISNSHITNILAPSVSVAQKLEQINVDPPIVSVTLGCDNSVFKFVGDNRDLSARPEIMILGRLDPVKGHQRFLNYFSQTLKMWPGILEKPFLHIAGEPANVSAKDIQRWTEEANLEFGSDVVLTTQRIEDLPQAFSKVTLGVVCSEGSEVICRVAEEFMLCGVPVFVSGVGSLSDVLVFKNSGVGYGGLSPEQVPEVLAGLIQSSFAEDSTVRNQRAGEAEKHFSLLAMGQALQKKLLS